MDKAAKIAKYAYEQGLTLRESALALSIMNEQEFDAAMNVESMLGPDLFSKHPS